MPDPLQELLAAGAVPTTTFPPTSRYADVGVDAWDPGGGGPPVPFLRRRFCPRAERLRAAVRGRASSRATAATCSARVTLGDAELWWRLADANGVVDPRDAHRADRPPPAHHAARGRAGAGCLSAVRLQLLIGPGVPVPGAARGARRGAGGQGRVELRRDAERLRDHASASRTARRCTRCSCSPAARASRSCASSSRSRSAARRPCSWTA